MNESGRAVAAAARFYRVHYERLRLHDELDLAAGKLRGQAGRRRRRPQRPAGIDALFGNGYWRVRLGIGHPGDKRRVLGHVLDDFDAEDRQWLDPLLAAIAEHAPVLVAGDPPAIATARWR
ncbi:MAG: aminoacyl-tRNA hydrolase [Rhodospirillales bacterium]